MSQLIKSESQGRDEPNASSSEIDREKLKDLAERASELGIRKVDASRLEGLSAKALKLLELLTDDNRLYIDGLDGSFATDYDVNEAVWGDDYSPGFKDRDDDLKAIAKELYSVGVDIMYECCWCIAR
jgi:hypothetical protein